MFFVRTSFIFVYLLIEYNMAKVDVNISSLVNGNGKSELLFRVNVNRNIRLRVKSGIFVYPNRFKNGGIVLPRAEDGKGMTVRCLPITSPRSRCWL